jgi:hypothetical protein
MNQRGYGPEEMSAAFGVRAALFCCLRAATLFAALGFGACTRIRTRDQLIKSQLLYQLSYAGAPAILASLDLGLRRSTTSSNHPLAFVNQLDVRVSVRAPARWNSPGSP